MLPISPGFFFATLFVLSCLGVAGPGFAASCSDSFENESLMESWSFIDSTQNEDARFEILDSSLHLWARGADVYNEKNFFAGVFREDILGDFDISVKILSQDKIHSWSQTGIVIANNSGDLSEGGYAFISVSEENGARYFWDSEGSIGTTDKNVGDSNPIQYPLWIRLKKTGLQITSYYKQDSSAAWTEIASGSTPQILAENSHIGLYSFSHDVNQTGEVVFDDFTCLHGEFEVGINPYLKPLPFLPEFLLKNFRPDGKHITLPQL